MTIIETVKYISLQLRSIYEEGEAASIADWVMEYITGLTKQQRMAARSAALTPEQEQQLNPILSRLQQMEPVQYVLNEAWFCGLKFQVDKNVLIPRPETEELVEWIISNCKFPVAELSILDIGAGSGCIPISLKRRLRKANVWSIDISEPAVTIARQNAVTLGTPIHFLQADILDKEQWPSFPLFDIIVSNPPYVPEKDKANMQPNVLKYEPGTALFVPDDDALLFYKAIAAFGKQHLVKGGSLYFEIHEDLGQAAVELLRREGYTTELKKDMQQKDRMIKSGLL